jgi:energy-converting hydrogenase Eha subunit F
VALNTIKPNQIKPIFCFFLSLLLRLKMLIMLLNRKDKWENVYGTEKLFR